MVGHSGGGGVGNSGRAVFVPDRAQQPHNAVQAVGLLGGRVTRRRAKGSLQWGLEEGIRPS